MAIYAISDLHLSFGIKSKPMDIFGAKWNDYINRLIENWKSVVREDDTVILAGDFSWATYLEEAKEDFEFLDKLPGKKILLKGNHDYWWTTMKKMNEFLQGNDFTSILFLHNNAYELEDFVIAGTRYWSPEDEMDNEKIFSRECERAVLSCKEAQRLNPDKPIIFVSHFPPDNRLISHLEEFNIQKWVYGHIHSSYEEHLLTIDNCETYLTSCDYLEFVPQNLG